MFLAGSYRQKRRAGASNGQRYPLPYCTHFGNLNTIYAGQRPQRGRCPVEHRRIYVRPFVWQNSSLCLGGMDEGAWGPGGEGSRSWPGTHVCSDGRTDGWTDGGSFIRLDVWADIIPCSTGHHPLWGHRPKRAANQIKILPKFILIN